jgi:hypothetical protein
MMFNINKQVNNIINRVPDLKLFSISNRRKFKSNRIDSTRNQIDVELNSM